jgi:hypothetical protein
LALRNLAFGGLPSDFGILSSCPKDGKSSHSTTGTLEAFRNRLARPGPARDDSSGSQGAIGAMTVTNAGNDRQRDGQKSGGVALLPAGKGT